jgi:thiol-disulfide isomerase/thioredoxin
MVAVSSDGTWKERVMASHRLVLMVAILVTTCFPGGSIAEDVKMTRPMSTAIARLPIEGKLPSLDGATRWLNSSPLRARELRGKVVLVDFWTYTCINWRRTLPYLRAWDAKYRDRGLIVLGVHTPEFSFEKQINNVRHAAKEQAVSYPVAIDNDYAIWNGFNNNYWPAVYLVDAKGSIRHHQFGEGEYEKLEPLIQQLLVEAGQPLPEQAVGVVEAEGAEAAADWRSLRTPETYVGYTRADNFVSDAGVSRDRPRAYASPAVLRLNQWGLEGRWTIKREFAVSHEVNGRIRYRFHARDVHLVMSPGARGTPARFRVTLDGRPPGESRGVDVDAEGRGTLDQPRMYQLIRQRGIVADRHFEIADRQIEIEFLDAGAEVFVFTFG